MAAERALLKPSTETALSLAEGGWQRAYVEWRATHGDSLWAVACAVTNDAALVLIHSLLEDAVRSGWEARRNG